MVKLPPQTISILDLLVVLDRFFQMLSCIQTMNLPTSCRDFHNTMTFKIPASEFSIVLDLVWEDQISSAIFFTLVIKRSSVYAAVAVLLWLAHNPFENKGSWWLKLMAEADNSAT